MVAKSITIQEPSNPLLPPQWGSGSFSSPSPIFMILLSIAILSTIAAQIDICFLFGTSSSTSLKMHQQVGCQCCQYFSDNSYLKCAVHPSTVLTERSIDCADYCLNS